MRQLADVIPSTQADKKTRLPLLKLVLATCHKIPKGSLVCHTGRMRRDDICLYVGPANRAELQVLLTNRNTPRKLVWRAEIVLATADG